MNNGHDPVTVTQTFQLYQTLKGKTHHKSCVKVSTKSRFLRLRRTIDNT